MMVDVTPTYQSAVKSINEDIEKLTAALSLVSEVRIKAANANNEALAQTIRLIGGEIAWLQSKRTEANKYLSGGE